MIYNFPLQSIFLMLLIKSKWAYKSDFEIKKGLDEL